jgi:glycosyltransferase involved in cell wall biosynthesis
MNNLKISVITVAYNSEVYLEKTIQSVTSQTYDNFEYIIVDGGSNDSTVDIIKKYNNKVDTWISESDNGIYNAMNKGIDLSSGEWIYFLNSGDTFTDINILSKISLFINSCKEDFSLIYGRLYLTNSKDVVVNIAGKSWIDTKKELKYKNSIPHQSVFVKRQNIIDVGKFDDSYRISGDYDLMLKMSAKYNVVFLDNLIVANMKIGGISSNPKNSLELLMEHRRAQKSNGYKYPDINWINAVARVYARKVVWHFVGESKGRVILDRANKLVGRVSYWSNDQSK